MQGYHLAQRRQHLLQRVLQTLRHLVLRVHAEAATEVQFGVLRVHHAAVEKRLVREQRTLVEERGEEIARREEQRVADLVRDADGLQLVRQRRDVDGRL